MSEAKTTIAELNDQFRTTFQGGRVLMTHGVQNFDRVVQQGIVRKVQNHSEFSEENDPYGEHDFGSFTWDNEKFFWKIDYYDPTGEFASENPGDPDKTLRVLTIMLASEY